MRRTLLSVALVIALAGCGQAPQTPPAAGGSEAATASTDTTANSLTAEWAGPYGGVPAFDQMKVADLEPAFDAVIAQHLAELDTIAAQAESATFANTIEAMEQTGQAFRRVQVYFGIWAGNLSSPEFREVQAKVAPKLAAYQSKIIQNEALFARVKAVREGSEFASLRPDQQRLVDTIYKRFQRFGAALDADKKKRYAEIDQELAKLQTRFSNNVLADEEGYVTYLDASQLGGLPKSFVDAAAAIAERKGQAGKYAVLNTRSSVDPFLTYSTERALREQVWRTFVNRGDNGDDKDNNALIAEILKLRHERVGLMGYPSYAAWVLEDRMAQSPERAFELMQAVWPSAVARAREEVADMQKLADAEGARITIEPWDYRFYAEKVRQARYAFDSNEVRMYLDIERLREAMFYVAGELFGMDFKPVPEGSVPVFHPDVRVWEVTQRGSGEHIGLWYLDPYAREGKRSGAWASSYRDHQSFAGKRTVLSSNNSNFIKAPPGEPVLVSWDDAATFFHEFGHALHSLSSKVAYPSLNWGVRDYTEFQSQLLERWLFTQPVIDQFLRHAETGEPMPAELVQKVRNASTFNQGFATVEYLASALIDMKLHMVDPAGIDPDAFEREQLTALGMPSEIVMRHRTPHFSHVFASEGYAAGYYGYLWAEVLTADATEAFVEAPGGFYDKELASKAVEYLFAARNAMDPAEAYRAFRGRDATIDALLRDRGFAAPNDAAEGGAGAGEE